MEDIFQKIINFYIKGKSKLFYKFLFIVFKNFIKGPFVLNFGEYKLYAYGNRKDLSRWMLKKLQPWDFDKVNKLKNIIKNTNSLFVDCGSNFGVYSIIIASLCKNTKVVSFDASSKFIKRLEENINLNNLTTVETHNLGISSVNSEQYFNDNDYNFKNLGSYRFEETPNSKIIKTIALDNFFQNKNLGQYANIVFKLDIEGYEYQALLGMTNLIKKYKPVILLEISRMLLVSKNFSRANFEKYINNHELKILDQDGLFISTNSLFDKFNKLSSEHDTIGDYFLVNKNRILQFNNR
tara:strand:+ start:553 stop:1437 length:885 start_codon:yes stop_codon:yes gene_type:complete